MKMKTIVPHRAGALGNICEKRTINDYTYSNCVSYAFEDDPELQIEGLPALVSKFNKPSSYLIPKSTVSDIPNTDEWFLYNTVKVYNQEDILQNKGWLKTGLEGDEMPADARPVDERTGITLLSIPIDLTVVGEHKIITWVTDKDPKDVEDPRWFSTATSIYVREKYGAKFTQTQQTDGSYLGLCEVKTLLDEGPLDDVQVKISWKIDGHIIQMTETMINGECTYPSDKEISVNECAIELLDHTDEYIIVDPSVRP